MTKMIKYFGNIELPVREWENYGDMDPINHGGLWVKPDVPTFPGCFYIVQTVPLDEEEGWFVLDGYVDINDDWINWPSVYSYSGIDWTYPAEVRAMEAFQYYGSHEFNGECKQVESEEELIHELDEWEIKV